MFRSLFLLVGCVAACVAAERRLEFSEYREGEVPRGFRQAQTGTGKPGEWKVIIDDVPPMMAPFSSRAPITTRRPVLAQLSMDRNGTRAPMFILEPETFGDFTFTTRLKIVRGEVEQMAGIAFRLQDERNYYYIRVNAKSRNIAFFRYVEGELIGPIAAAAEVRTNEWLQLTVECRGSRLRALLGGKEAIPWTEPGYVPFPDGTSKGVFNAGQIGFWTKADTVAHFAETHIEYTPRESLAQVLVRDTMQNHPRLLGVKIFAVPRGETVPKVVASNKDAELGQPGETVEKNCIEKGGTYYGKGKELVVVTMPLHDRNGDVVGAVRVEMTTFFGQTEKNALARALPIVKAMERRITSGKELLQAL